MNAAKKAWKTRRARAEFIRKYGQTAYNVIKHILKNNQMSAELATNRSSEEKQRQVVAAYKAHLTRTGRFKAMVDACNL